MKRFSIGVLPMIGLPSMVMSITPPQVRITRSRLKGGYIAIAAWATCSMTGRLPRWAYEL